MSVEFDLKLETLLADQSMHSLLTAYLERQKALYDSKYKTLKDANYKSSMALLKDLTARLGGYSATMELINYYVYTRLDGDWRSI